MRYFLQKIYFLGLWGYVRQQIWQQRGLRRVASYLSRGPRTEHSRSEYNGAISQGVWPNRRFGHKIGIIPSLPRTNISLLVDFAMIPTLSSLRYKVSATDFTHLRITRYGESICRKHQMTPRRNFEKQHPQAGPLRWGWWQYRSRVEISREEY